MGSSFFHTAPELLLNHEEKQQPVWLDETWKVPELQRKKSADDDNRSGLQYVRLPVCVCVCV